MTKEMTPQSGWVVRSLFLRNEPKDKNDLVVEVRMVADFKIDDLCPTEEEAWKLARQHLLERRNQALRDLDFLSTPYTSPNGVTYICPEEKIEEWREEARISLGIAEKGLELCPA